MINIESYIDDYLNNFEEKFSSAFNYKKNHLPLGVGVSVF